MDQNPSAFPEVPGDNNGYEGRSGMSLRDWFAAYADYFAEGLRQFDAGETNVRGAHNRTAYAHAFAEVAMPPKKLAAHRAEQRAKLYAEFGESPYCVGAFGVERRA